MFQTFTTIIAWIFGIFSLIRIIAILFFQDKDQKELIRLAEAYGMNPIMDALVWPFIILIFSVVWIFVSW